MELGSWLSASLMGAGWTEQLTRLTNVLQRCGLPPKQATMTASYIHPASGIVHKEESFRVGRHLAAVGPLHVTLQLFLRDLTLLQLPVLTQNCHLEAPSSPTDLPKPLEASPPPPQSLSLSTVFIPGLPETTPETRCGATGKHTSTPVSSIQDPLHAHC